MLHFFFFQAEDGIRDYKVTGVQTCALPICIQPIDHFLRAVRHIVNAAPFKGSAPQPSARIERADARYLPVRTASTDYVITSPPYLNAIDYLRGHRLSLVWMGHSVDTIREIRSESVGSEAGD